MITLFPTSSGSAKGAVPPHPSLPPATDYRYEALKKYLDEPAVPEFLDQKIQQPQHIKNRKQELKKQLRKLGASPFDLTMMESRKLYRFLHPGETVKAAINGWVPDGGFAMLVATTKRIMWLKVRPFYSLCEDVAYGEVGAVTMSENKWFAAVTLHTHSGDYQLNFATLKAARHFVNYAESKSLTPK